MRRLGRANGVERSEGPALAPRLWACGPTLGVNGVVRAALGATALLSLLLASACSYRFVAPGSTLPEGIKRLHVPVFENGTTEAGAEGLFTEALRSGLLRAGRLGDDASEARLAGRLLSVSTAPVVATPGRLPTYRLAAQASFVLTRRGRVVAQQTLGGAEDFPSGADVLWTESNRAAALSRLAEALGQQALEWLSSAGPPDHP